MAIDPRRDAAIRAQIKMHQGLMDNYADVAFKYGTRNLPNSSNPLSPSEVAKMKEAAKEAKSHKSKIESLTKELNK